MTKRAKYARKGWQGTQAVLTVVVQSAAIAAGVAAVPKDGGLLLTRMVGGAIGQIPKVGGQLKEAFAKDKGPSDWFTLLQRCEKIESETEDEALQADAFERIKEVADLLLEREEVLGSTFVRRVLYGITPGLVKVAKRPVNTRVKNQVGVLLDRIYDYGRRHGDRALSKRAAPGGAAAASTSQRVTARSLLREAQGKDREQLERVKADWVAIESSKLQCYVQPQLAEGLPQQKAFELGPPTQESRSPCMLNATPPVGQDLPPAVATTTTTTTAAAAVALPVEASDAIELRSSDEVFASFLASDGRVLVLLGHSGTGKSVECRRLAADLAERRSKYVPHVVELREHPDDLEAHLDSVCSSPGVSYLFFLDGRNELPSRSNLIQKFHLDKYTNAKFVFTCQPRFYRGETSLFSWPSTGAEARVVHIARFDRDQYLAELVRVDPSFKVDLFKQLVDRSSLSALAQTPLNLRLLIDLYKKTGSLEVKGIRDVYAGILHDRFLTKAREINPDVGVDVLTEDMDYYCQQVAWEMFRNPGARITIGGRLRRGSPKSDMAILQSLLVDVSALNSSLLGRTPTAGDLHQSRQGGLVALDDGRPRFEHQMFEHYFLARHLYSVLERDDAGWEACWGHDLFVGYPGVVQFLTDQLVHRGPPYADDDRVPWLDKHLFSLVKGILYRDDEPSPPAIRAAINAGTILAAQTRLFPDCHTEVSVHESRKLSARIGDAYTRIPGQFRSRISLSRCTQWIVGGGKHLWCAVSIYGRTRVYTSEDGGNEFDDFEISAPKGRRGELLVELKEFLTNLKGEQLGGALFDADAVDSQLWARGDQ